MQITSGKFRGLKLKWVSDSKTRPTTARVKENIFNILTSMRKSLDFTGVFVLDLFAGSGQMGLECISRGAADVILNDCNKDAYNIIKSNCKSINYNGQILNLDYKACIEKLKTHKFDIIFLDPPYEDNEVLIDALRLILEHQILAKNGIIVVENEGVECQKWGGRVSKTGGTERFLEGSNLSIKIKKYGRATVCFLSEVD